MIIQVTLQVDSDHPSDRIQDPSALCVWSAWSTSTLWVNTQIKLQVGSDHQSDWMQSEINKASDWKGDLVHLPSKVKG